MRIRIGQTHYLLFYIVCILTYFKTPYILILIAFCCSGQKLNSSNGQVSSGVINIDGVFLCHSVFTALISPCERSTNKDSSAFCPPFSNSLRPTHRISYMSSHNRLLTKFKYSQPEPLCNILEEYMCSSFSSWWMLQDIFYFQDQCLIKFVNACNIHYQKMYWHATTFLYGISKLAIQYWIENM